MITRVTPKIIFLSLTALVGIAIHSCLSPAPASALSGSQFNASNIMDDSVFFNASTMSANDIQAFLNAKVPSCDTNGTQPYGSGTRASYGAANGNPAPYTCLKSYVQNTESIPAESGLCNNYDGGTKSAAQIIYDVGRVCGVNPQVLIVLLQKEQSLVTDDWPWAIQYTKATGYGCPDTAACDSTYGGFFHQVYYAARGFKKYARDAASYNYRAGRNNNIQYNPSTSCGYSTLFLQSQATAGLYNYTPYQPNTAALNNLYGTGDSCSAYGNRNFWRMFNDWFGPTVGPLVRTTTSGDLYYSDGATKYRVGSMDLAAEYGLGLSSVRIISQSAMDALQTSNSPQYLTYIVKSTSDSDDDGGMIYLIAGGMRYAIPSMTLFNHYGFDLSQLSMLEYSQLLRMPLVGNLTQFVKSKGTGQVYKIEDGKKHAIVDYNTFTQVDPSGVTQDLSDYQLNSIALGTAIINTTLVMKDAGGGIWLVANNVWHYVSSMDTYNCMGLGGLANIPFTNSLMPVGTQGADAGCVVTSASNQRYIMDNWRKIPIDPSWGFSSFFSVADDYLARFSVYNPSAKPVFRNSPSGALYVFSSGKKRQIYSMSSFNEQGFTLNDLFTTTTDFLATIPTGPFVLASGTIIRDTSDGRLYVMTSDTKYGIPSMQIFNSYGYDASRILDLPASMATTYTTAGNITSQVAYATGATVFDSGIALQVSSALESSYGFSGATPTYPSAVASSGAVRQGTRYLKFGSSAQLYYLENGTKRPVYSWDTFVLLGGSNNNITGLSASAANLFPTGPSM